MRHPRKDLQAGGRGPFRTSTGHSFNPNVDELTVLISHTSTFLSFRARKVFYFIFSGIFFTVAFTEQRNVALTRFHHHRGIVDGIMVQFHSKDISEDFYGIPTLKVDFNGSFKFMSKCRFGGWEIMPYIFGTRNSQANKTLIEGPISELEKLNIVD